MTDPANKQPYVLVPEMKLLETLPAHHKKRFEMALFMMHNSLAESLSWEQIAQESAISPYHFHRQFSQLFGETPGQYLGRVRLQYAVSLLSSETPLKITDIAHECGYSSSQAMAKVLKRELGMTAKSLHQFVVSGTSADMAQLLDKLSHPGSNQSIEKQLAQEMPTELVWYPARGMKVKDIPNFDWDDVFETLGEKSTRLMSTAPISELERKWKDISFTVGDWQVDSEHYDYFIPEGYYLCCEVYLVSDIAYLAAIEGLFEQAEILGYQVNESAHLIEMVHHVDMSPIGGATFAFQIPIII